MDENYGFEIFEKVPILRPFSGLAPSNSICSSNFIGSTCAYRYILLMLRQIKAPTPLRSLR